MRGLSFILSTLLLVSTVQAYETRNVEKEYKYMNMTINKSETEIKIKADFDLGLGDNLMEGVFEKISKKIDDEIDPYIEKLEKYKKRNMQKLNSKNFLKGDEGDRMSEKWMEFIDFDSAEKSLKKFKKNNKSGISGSLFNGDKWKADSSPLNPFNHFRELVEEKTQEYKDKIDEWSILTDEQKEKLTKASEKFEKHRKISADSLLKQSLEVKDANNKQSLLISLVKGDNPSEALDTFYKSEYPQFSSQPVKLSFSPMEAILPTNNMCDLTKCLFGDCDIKGMTKEEAEAKKEELVEKAEELRKALYQKAITLMATKLIKEFYVEEYIQYIQKAMSCSVEATMATTSDSLGFSFSNPGTSFIQGATTDKAKPGTEQKEVAGTNAQSIKNSVQKTADCLRIDNEKTKTETNIDGTVGGHEQGTQTVIYPVQAAVFVPFVGVGGSVKGATDSSAKIYANKQQSKSCILEGKSQTWKDSFNTCMDSSSTTKKKIKADIKIEIGKLFKKLRKHKKVECELTKQKSETETLNFSLLKYTTLIPSLTDTDKATGENDHKKFMESIALLINEDITISKIKTNNQVELSNIFLNMSEGGKTKVVKVVSVDGKETTFDTSKTSEEVKESLRIFCNDVGEYILKSEKTIKKKFEDKDKDFIEEINPFISDLNYCSDKYKEFSFKSKLKPITNTVKELKKKSILEYKYRMEGENKIDYGDLQSYMDNVSDTYTCMDEMSNKEKETICSNFDRNKQIEDITFNTTAEKLNQKYSKKTVESAVEQYCVEYKSTIFDNIYESLVNDFDNPTISSSKSNTTLKEVEKQLEELEKEGF
jgi:hypothetical protein